MNGHYGSILGHFLAKQSLLPIQPFWQDCVLVRWIKSETVSKQETISDVKKSGDRVQLRKNVNTLTEGEKEALQIAMQAVIDSGTFAKLANFHGLPLTMCDPFDLSKKDPESLGGRSYFGGCCPHDGHVDFLPWHRLLITNLDKVQSTLGFATSLRHRDRGR